MGPARTQVEAGPIGAPERALAVLALELRQGGQPRRAQRRDLGRQPCGAAAALGWTGAAAITQSGDMLLQHKHQVYAYQYQSTLRCLQDAPLQRLDPLQACLTTARRLARRAPGRSQIQAPQVPSRSGASSSSSRLWRPVNAKAGKVNAVDAAFSLCTRLLVRRSVTLLVSSSS